MNASVDVRCPFGKAALSVSSLSLGISMCADILGQKAVFLPYTGSFRD